MNLPDTSSPQGYVVPLPHLGDAVGEALRSVFCEQAMPSDMRALLLRLDCVEQRPETH